MVDRSNVSAGSCLGMVAVAVVSTGVILASYHLFHRRLESNLKLSSTVRKKKKVRFADDVAATDLTSDGDQLRRSTTAGAGGKLVRPALRKAAYSSTHLAC